jgi:pyruvate-formate lyase-activating enzyme
MKPGFPTPEGADFPQMVVLSITNACEFSCRHCYFPAYVSSPAYRRRDMEIGVFRRIADEIGQYPHSILRFLAWGEPLLHPELAEFTRYARSVAPANPLTLITNGYWLTPDRSLELMDAGLDLVEVSIDAAGPEEYQRERESRHANALQQVEENVRAMLRQRAEHGHSTRVVVSFIVYPTPESAADLQLFRQKWADVADEVIVRPVHTFKGVVTGVAPLPVPRPPCYGLWTRCNINPWGQVLSCYNDWENSQVLGDLREPQATIRSLWLGPVLTHLREQQARGVFLGLCATCRDYNPNAWERPYEQVVGRCPARSM